MTTLKLYLSGADKEPRLYHQVALTTGELKMHIALEDGCVMLDLGRELSRTLDLRRFNTITINLVD